MIEVTCPASRFNTHRERYNRRNDASMITLKIDENGVKFEMDLTVAEAESLANDLREWAKEIKGEEDVNE